jgi:hypothetical protein
MPDVGDSATVTLEVEPFDGSTVATLTVNAPDGSTPSVAAPATTDGGNNWSTIVDYTLDGWYLLSWEVNGTGEGVEHQRVYVSPAPSNSLPPLYASPDDLKAMRRIDGNQDDAMLLSALSAACRQIDNRTGRRFYLDAVPTARVFDTLSRTSRSGVLLVDDIGTASGLLTAAGTASTATWSPITGATFGPENALLRGRPITSLAHPAGWWFGPQIQVTARWGWPTVPEEIRVASLMLANRFYLRKDSPEGVTGSSEWGVIRLSRWDPDVEALIAPYVLPGFA